jgi:hypothetical protein
MLTTRVRRATVRRSSRRVVLVALLLGHLAAAAGFVVPIPGRGKDTSRPYPCMDRPCGCTSYEECWAGDCCCFTLQEKVAWVRAHGVQPPARAVQAAEPTEAACGEGACPCCAPRAEEEPCPHCREEDAAAFRWVVGALAQRCKGNPLAGWWLLPPAVPPPPPVTWAFDWAAAGTVTPADAGEPVSRPEPAEPPPKT